MRLHSDYFRLYDTAAAAVKAVDRRLKVGGPATAAAGWVADFAAHVSAARTPLDFLTTHTYGNVPLDVAATARDAGLESPPVWWTEWGISPTHFAGINDSVLAAPFVLHGVFSAMERAEFLAYWVVSDHFEELGRPPRLFHGGFGLLTVGNLRKPHYWALRMLQMLGDERLAVELAGDGAGSLVNALAARDAEGVALLVWNGTLDQSKAGGDPLLERELDIAFDGLPEGGYRLEQLRVDSFHSNVLRTWEAIGRPDWPDREGWLRLRAGDRLEALEPPRRLAVRQGFASLRVKLPMPSVSLVRLLPA